MTKVSLSITKVLFCCVCSALLKQCLGKSLLEEQIPEEPEDLEQGIPKHRFRRNSFADTVVKWKQLSENQITGGKDVDSYMVFIGKQKELPGGDRAQKLTCRDTGELATKALKYEGIMIEIKTKKTRRYNYLVAIDHKGQVHWNGELGWKHKIGKIDLAEGKGTMAPERGNGGLTLLVPGDDCEKEDGEYKCIIFSYMPIEGKPGESILQQTRKTYNTEGKLRCNNPNLPQDAPDDDDNKPLVNNKDKDNKDDVEVKPVEKPREEGGTNVGLVVVALLIVVAAVAGGLILYKRKKAAEAKKAEEEKKKQEAARKKRKSKKKKAGNEEGKSDAEGGQEN